MARRRCGASSPAPPRGARGSRAAERAGRTRDRVRRADETTDRAAAGASATAFGGTRVGRLPHRAGGAHERRTARQRDRGRAPPPAHRRGRRPDRSRQRPRTSVGCFGPPMASSACANARCSSEPSSPSRVPPGGGTEVRLSIPLEGEPADCPVKSRPDRAGAKGTTPRVGRALRPSRRDPGIGWSRQQGCLDLDSGLDGSDRSRASCATTGTSTGSSRKMRSASASSESRCSEHHSCGPATSGDACRRSVAFATSLCSPDAIFVAPTATPVWKREPSLGVPTDRPPVRVRHRAGSDAGGRGWPPAGGQPRFVAAARSRRRTRLGQWRQARVEVRSSPSTASLARSQRRAACRAAFGGPMQTRQRCRKPLIRGRR